MLKYSNETIIFILSVLAILAAYVLEYMGFKPCILCIYQRYIYYTIILIYFCKKLLKGHLLNIYRFLIGVEIIMAVYHVLTEKGIFQPTLACQETVPLPSDVSEALKIIQHTIPSGCNIPTYVVPFVSLAEINLLFALFLLIFSFRSAYYAKIN